ncbi:MAG: hypothetical protein M1816_000806 [Peltula sp. TS41687]|nr:MAG: hypothetical protein M1816_000806 [Peltula sp. TS41687]
MGLGTTTSAFSNDVLRVEISGPDRPQLTIVDLPGLIHSENKLQTAADVKLVQDMVQQYMVNRRSVILAVVSAKNDYANQIVLRLAREVDRNGLRTLGIITKLDTLPINSESEAGFANLARNQDVEFRLGWHVLRKRDYETRNTTIEARNEMESQFFSQGIWKDFPRGLVGIDSLRQRLSKVLLDQIRTELPSLIVEIDSSVQDCRAKLAKLGESRAGLGDQRLFLLKISQSFQLLLKAATDGTYGDAFFGEPRSTEGYTKRLRAVIQNLNLSFAESMRRQGHRYHIVETLDSSHASGTQQPEIITRTEYLKHVLELLKRSRGRELPGMSNPLIVGDLFHEQSQRWRVLARDHLRAVCEATRTFLDLTVSYLANETTSDAVLKELSVRESRLESEVTQRLQKILGNREDATLLELSQKRVRLTDLAAALAKRNEADMDTYACSEALDCMKAYYKVALKNITDNIAIYVVERTLVLNLGDMLSPARILQMEPELVSRLAAESQETSVLRDRLQRKLMVLQAGAEVSLQDLPSHVQENELAEAYWSDTGMDEDSVDEPNDIFAEVFESQPVPPSDHKGNGEPFEHPTVEGGLPTPIMPSQPLEIFKQPLTWPEMFMTPLTQTEPKQSKAGKKGKKNSKVATQKKLPKG